MRFTDKLKRLRTKAQETTATHTEQIHKAVEKAQETADQQTGGKYHEQITKTGQKAEAFVNKLAESERTAAGPPPTDAPPDPSPANPAQ